MFNRREVVGRAVRSVFAQREAEFEVLLVDDGSTDGSAEVARAEFGNDVRIIVNVENRGVSAARNSAVGRARGAWIAFLDSDDEWMPQKLARQIQQVSCTGLQICHTDEIWIRNGVRVNPHKHHEKSGGDIFLKSLELCAMSPSSLLVRRDLLLAAGGFDETLPVCEDYDLFLRLTCRRPVAYLAEKLIVKYGGHDDQLSRRYPAMDRFRVQAIDKLLRGEEQLEITQKQAAVAALLRKSRIVLNGAVKRNNPKLAQSMREYIERWSP